jgi:hypothetical protein
MTNERWNRLPLRLPSLFYLDNLRELSPALSSYRILFPNAPSSNPPGNLSHGTKYRQIAVGFFNSTFKALILASKLSRLHPRSHCASEIAPTTQIA